MSYKKILATGIILLSIILSGCTNNTINTPTISTQQQNNQPQNTVIVDDGYITSQPLEYKEIDVREYELSGICVSAFTENTELNGVVFSWNKNKEKCEYINVLLPKGTPIRSSFSNPNELTKEDEEFLLNFFQELPSINETTNTNNDLYCVIEYILIDENGNFISQIKEIVNTYPDNYDEFANTFNQLVNADVLSQIEIKDITSDQLSKLSTYTDNDVLYGTIKDVIDYYEITPRSILKHQFTNETLNNYCKYMFLDKMQLNNINRYTNLEDYDYDYEEYEENYKEYSQMIKTFAEDCGEEICVYRFDYEFDAIDDTYIYKYFDSDGSTEKTKYVCSKDGKYIISNFDEDGDFIKLFYDLEYN